MQDLPFTIYLILTIFAFTAGIWFCKQAIKWLERDDPSVVVWDEVVGYLITMFAAPLGWYWMLIGFLLFRLFDILKPWPIGYFDRNIHGGLGIMLDDIIAGLFALVIVQWLCLYI